MIFFTPKKPEMRAGRWWWGAVCVLYSIYSTPTLLGEASKIWEVRRNSAGSPQEVGRNFFLSCYPTRSTVEPDTSVQNGFK
jgi:hypothetical protein